MDRAPSASLFGVLGVSYSLFFEVLTIPIKLKVPNPQDVLTDWITDADLVPVYGTSTRLGDWYWIRVTVHVLRIGAPVN